MQAIEHRHLFEVIITAVYTVNQLVKSHQRNRLAKYFLVLSLFTLISHYIFKSLLAVRSIVEVGGQSFSIFKLAINFFFLSEALFISTLFLINNSILSKFYAFFRIPTFLSLKTMSLEKLEIDQDQLHKIINIVYGFEIVLASSVLISNVINNKNRNRNVKTLILLLFLFTLPTYFINLFKLPFDMNEHNRDLLNAIKQVLLLSIYLVLANTISNKKCKNQRSFEDPKKILDLEQERISEMIEFSE